MDDFTITENVIKYVTGTAIPKLGDDQNTDQIVPARFLKEVTYRNMGKYPYFDERFTAGKTIPDHPFNDPSYKAANVLIVGSNYGCGSSREHAPQALKRFGINAIIAGSYAEIFASNCEKIGLVAVTVPEKYILQIAQQVQQKPSMKIKVDLEKKLVTYDGNEVGLEMPEGRRQAFLKGTWDALALLQKNEGKIKEIEAKLLYLGFE